MHRYPWIDLRALGAQAGAVAADAARSARAASWWARPVAIRARPARRRY